ncbi:MAG: metallophosphoesterase family protein [Bacteroidia bacterium]|nr:metallophosphatase family protein [Bacteroidia bacterium]MDW8158314.1 metallophosphoesterase family protein [Bacteroidia bacterium]
MHIALISDIHANLPALQATLEAINSYAPGAIYCLGDLVGYGPYPNEVIETIRKHTIPTLAGNYDYAIGRNSNDCGCAYKNEEEKTWGQNSIAYTNAAITAPNRQYLLRLPSQIQLVFHEEKHTYKILLVHGSPRKINEYLYEDRPENSFLRLLQQADCNILLCGHTHLPYYKKLWDPTTQSYRYIINVGSVGKPKDGNPQACFVILNLDNWQKIIFDGALSIEFVRTPYDVEKIAQAIEQEPSLPNVYAQMLRKGQ